MLEMVSVQSEQCAPAHGTRSVSKRININILSRRGDIRVDSRPMGREIEGPPFVGPSERQHPVAFRPSGCPYI